MKHTILIRGGGDLASAVIHKLRQSGFRVVVCDLPSPSCVRRTVSYCNAIYEGDWTIEGVTSRHIRSLEEIEPAIRDGLIPVLTLPDRQVRDFLKPDVFIDATLSKRTPDYDLSWAPLVIGLGPGIEAGKQAHVVIETKRGHYLGRLVHQGQALANTGIPGNIEGVDKDRVLRAPREGVTRNLHEIGDQVVAGDVILMVGEVPVKTVISGVVRGLIADGFQVRRGQKLGDVDPRGDADYTRTISDKGRTIAGGVLEAILAHFGE
ncbi:MAG TPA: selenium-dependent molybdenum cofactor biosynthesis protein YqeB [Bacillota bacterium]|jgi:xanthine dehydrogenase accessory factor|nr:EF2563 family selenium-dependent molybdenum hydroxylase system protein [Fastidiosipila sp.]HPX93087.1 selenium-dependent molybdenum cofactor biosynthesis protein YqeB [Bacillota bacterium]HQB80840.1 selenium-dependent molybdenum cofactor biosynthesis protein YqeB [Bacillota bacterium]